jgi:hypothetical protein
MKKIIGSITVAVLLGGCYPGIGVRKQLNIERYDLRNSVTAFCEKNHRPPESQEVQFGNRLMAEYYWFISDYIDKDRSKYVVFIIEKEDQSVAVLYSGTSLK